MRRAGARSPDEGVLFWQLQAKIQAGTPLSDQDERDFIRVAGGGIAAFIKERAFEQAFGTAVRFFCLAHRQDDASLKACATRILARFKVVGDSTESIAMAYRLNDDDAPDTFAMSRESALHLQSDLQAIEGILKNRVMESTSGFTGRVFGVVTSLIMILRAQPGMTSGGGEGAGGGVSPTPRVDDAVPEAAGGRPRASHRDVVLPKPTTGLNSGVLQSTWLLGMPTSIVAAFALTARLMPALTLANLNVVMTFALLGAALLSWVVCARNVAVTSKLPKARVAWTAGLTLLGLVGQALAMSGWMPVSVPAAMMPAIWLGAAAVIALAVVAIGLMPLSRSTVEFTPGQPRGAGDLSADAPPATVSSPQPATPAVSAELGR